MNDCILILSLTEEQYMNMLHLLEKQSKEIAADILRFTVCKDDAKSSSVLHKFKTDNPDWLLSINADLKSLELLLETNLSTKRILVSNYEAYWDNNKVTK